MRQMLGCAPFARALALHRSARRHRRPHPGAAGRGFLSRFAAVAGLAAISAACYEDATAPVGEAVTAVPAAGQVTPQAVVENNPRLALLGERLFFDQNLSINGNQACASCHDPEWGFTLPMGDVNAGGATAPGSFTDRFGDRKPPTNAYATPSPILSLQGTRFVGGVFWDGRATGEELGNPAADQALGPFVNAVEQAFRDPACVVLKVRESSYQALYQAMYGRDIYHIEYPDGVYQACAEEGGYLDLAPDMREMVNTQYNNVALAIATFEHSPKVNQFSSKFDKSLAGQAQLTEQEQLGLGLFTGKAACSFCHVSSGARPLFTDFRYNNIGVPINPLNPALQADPSFRDPGLAGFLETRPEWAGLAPANLGTVKTPTLRNVDRRPFPGAVKAYMHNGYFKSLEGVVNFYNTRDVKPTCPNPLTTAADAMAQGCWPEPEVNANVNAFIGDLGLTPEEEAAIVAFLKTLSDGFSPAGSSVIAAEKPIRGPEPPTTR